jgi:hemerythrin
MAGLPTTDPLQLDLGFMDQGRQRFMSLLQQVEAAGEADLAAAWRRLTEQAAADFGREDCWMRNTAFASRRPHMAQHHVVLEVMREGLQHAASGRLPQLRQMAQEFRDWYSKHVQTMDAALALHLRGAGVES